MSFFRNSKLLTSPTSPRLWNKSPPEDLQIERYNAEKPDIYSSAGESLVSANTKSILDQLPLNLLDKPPISYADLELLTGPNELEDTFYKSTYQSKPESKTSTSCSVTENKNKNTKEKPTVIIPSKQKSSRVEKVLKEPDSIFGSILSKIDHVILEEKMHKKKEKHNSKGELRKDKSPEKKPKEKWVDIQEKVYKRLENKYNPRPKHISKLELEYDGVDKDVETSIQHKVPVQNLPALLEIKSPDSSITLGSSPKTPLFEPPLPQINNFNQNNDVFRPDIPTPNNEVHFPSRTNRFVTPTTSFPVNPCYTQPLFPNNESQFPQNIHMNNPHHNTIPNHQNANFMYNQQPFPYQNPPINRNPYNAISPQNDDFFPKNNDFYPQNNFFPPQNNTAPMFNDNFGGYAPNRPNFQNQPHHNNNSFERIIGIEKRFPIKDVSHPEVRDSWSERRQDMMARTRDPRVYRLKSYNRNIRKDTSYNSHKKESEWEELGRSKEEPKENRDEIPNKIKEGKTSNQILPKEKEQKSKPNEAMSKKQDESDEKPRTISKDPRIAKSKYDEIYSNLESSKKEETFVSPLDSLYSNLPTSKVNKGYGIQKFKIPKKPKPIVETKTTKADAAEDWDAKKENSEAKEDGDAKTENWDVKEDWDAKIEKPKEETKKDKEPDTSKQIKENVEDSDEEIIKRPSRRARRRRIRDLSPDLEEEEEEQDVPAKPTSSSEPEVKESAPGPSAVADSNDSETTEHLPTEDASTTNEPKISLQQSIEGWSKGILSKTVFLHYMDSLLGVQYMKKYEKIKKIIEEDYSSEEGEDKMPPTTKIENTETEKFLDAAMVELKKITANRRGRGRKKSKKIKPAVKEKVATEQRVQVKRKPRKGRRTELDKLHEDLKEVMGDKALQTAGKRQCTLSKEDLAAKNEEANREEEARKRAQAELDRDIDSSPQSSPQLRVRRGNLRVLLEKTDLSKLVNTNGDLLLEPSGSLSPKIIRSKQDKSDTESSGIASPKCKPRKKILEDFTDEELISNNENEEKLEKKKTKATKKKKSNWAAGVIKKKKKNSKEFVGIEEEPEKYSMESVGNKEESEVAPVCEEVASKPKMDEINVDETKGKVKIDEDKVEVTDEKIDIALVENKMEEEKEEETVKIKTEDEVPEPKEEVSENKIETTVANKEIHRKDHYIQLHTKMECLLCSYKGFHLASHYNTSHPESEILISRLPPSVAEESVQESEELNFHQIEPVHMMENKQKLVKFNFRCRFCNLNMHNETACYFYDHITTHTGEYRFRCNHCRYASSVLKGLRLHSNSVHKKPPHTNIPSPPLNFRYVFGYICTECNFVQLRLHPVETHVQTHHPGKNVKIVKISMSDSDTEKETELHEGKQKTKTNNADMKIFMCDGDVNMVDKNLNEARLKKMQEISDVVRAPRSSMAERIKSKLDSSKTRENVPEENKPETKTIIPIPLTPIVPFIEVAVKTEPIDTTELVDEKLNEVDESNPVTEDDSSKGTVLPEIISRMQNRLTNETDSFDSTTTKYKVGFVEIRNLCNKTFFNCFAPSCLFTSEDAKVFEDHCLLHDEICADICELCKVKMECSGCYTKQIDVFKHLMEAHVSRDTKYKEVAVMSPCLTGNSSSFETNLISNSPVIKMAENLPFSVKILSVESQVCIMFPQIKFNI